jgi:major vault protein
MADNSRERDLVLAPNEYAFISDQTKGNINVYVGPYKTSLANTDQPVFFDEKSKRFERCMLEPAIRVFATAPEGWYLVLKNPAKDGEQPKTGTVNNLMQLHVGHKVNIPGPQSFALWPGQMVKVVKGHTLRSNQYLTVRVYDEESARKHWSAAVVKLQTSADDGAQQPAAQQTPDFTLGQQLIIKGTEVSFYIPPTGIEVVPDAAGSYIRDAVTLERLEYCILLDEDGNKRFIQGPAVVFPEPTETFVERDGLRKFKAIELNELSGIYVKVIAPYTEGGAEFKVGQELFITGKEQMIYFPRPEHALIKYGNREIHYAVAIPAGEGRYCLDRQTGQIRLVRGPAMFLPDPRREVIVRRVLTDKQVALWYPGNREAQEYNARLQQMMSQRGAPGGAVITDGDLAQANILELAAKQQRRSEAAEGFAGDDFNRKQQFSPPRTITLDTKYEGAVTIGVWTGYAVKVVSKSGERKVIVGPNACLLEYDETLETMELSTGTPKTDTNLLRTVYLRALHNKISDLVDAETRDLCQVHVHLSYRVNFEGDPNLWFNVENFVKFLTDHMRSLLRNAIKQHGIQSFYSDAIAVIRDAVLGKADAGGKRPGRTFEENGMRIYDVEVLGVRLGDAKIEELLTQAQHSVVQQTLDLASEQRRLAFVSQQEDVKRQIMETLAQTTQKELALREEEVARRLAVRLAEIAATNSAQAATLEGKTAEQEALTKIHDAEIARQKAAQDAQVAFEAQKLAQRLEELAANVDGTVKKAAAISPDLIAALQAFSDRALVERVAESMAPLAILGGKSVSEVLAGLLQGSALEKVTALVPTPEKGKK